MTTLQENCLESNLCGCYWAHLQPLRPPLTPNSGLATPAQSKLASQIAAKRCHTTVFCIDSLLEHTIALPNSTTLDPFLNKKPSCR